MCKNCKIIHSHSTCKYCFDEICILCCSSSDNYAHAECLRLVEEYWKKRYMYSLTNAQPFLDTIETQLPDNFKTIRWPPEEKKPDSDPPSQLGSTTSVNKEEKLIGNFDPIPREGISYEVYKALYQATLRSPLKVITPELTSFENFMTSIEHQTAIELIRRDRAGFNIHRRGGWP